MFSRNLLSTLLLGLVYRVNYLSTSGQLGENLVNLRDVFPFVYMPTGWTFGIAWGVIYASLGIWLVWSWTSSGTYNKKNQEIQPWFWTTCLLNILRIISTANERYPLSVTVLIFLMLVLRYIISQSTISSWFLRIPFGLYTGRVTLAATLLGISQALYSYGYERVTASRRTPIAISIGIGFAGFVFWKRRNPAQLLITLFALVGVASSIFGF